MRAVANLVSCVRNPPFGAPLTLLFAIVVNLVPIFKVIQKAKQSPLNTF